MFATKGYDATSMDEISAAVGASKAAIYHYFDSKGALYDDLIIGTLTAVLRAVTEAIERESTPSGRMRAYIAAQITYMESHSAAVAMVVHSTSLQNRVFTPREIQLREALEAAIGAILAGGVKDGSFRRLDILMTQRAILGTLAWIPKWHHRAAGGGVKISRIIKSYSDLILAGLEA